MSGSGQRTTVLTSFSGALTARVTDAAGKPVSGITVVFELPGSAANGTFAGSTIVVTDTSGVATAPVLTANTIAGVFTINAYVAGVATPASFIFRNVPGPVAGIVTAAGASESATARGTPR